MESPLGANLSLYLSPLNESIEFKSWPMSVSLSASNFNVALSNDDEEKKRLRAII